MNDSGLRIGVFAAAVMWGCTLTQAIAAWCAYVAATPTLALMLVGSSGVTSVAACALACRNYTLRVARLVRITSGVAIVPESTRLHSVRTRSWRDG